MTCRAFAFALMIGGALVAGGSLVFAMGTSMDMDPPYDSSVPYLGVAAVAAVIVYVGWRLLRRLKFGKVARHDPYCQ